MVTKPVDSIASLFPHDPFSGGPFSGGESQHALLAMIRLQGIAMKAVLRHQIEALDFLKRRFEKDFRLIDDLRESGKHGDMFDVYADFMREAFSDYGEEAARLASLESDLASEASSEIRKEARTVAEDADLAHVA